MFSRRHEVGRRFGFALMALLIAPATGRAGAALDLPVYQQQAGRLFGAEKIVADGSPLSAACDHVLLMMQAVAVTIIVAGMIGKLRKDHEQMEGIASMLLRVAFIATIPFWKPLALETADTIADAVGPPAVHAAGQSGPVMTSLWTLAGQWMPANSPYLDALDDQANDNLPTSGEEQEWTMRAWNWARGITATTNNAFASMWHAFSGSLRALFVLLCCAAMTCLSLGTLLLVYLAAIARMVLFHFGCALLPVFIAGLGVDSLRGTSMRFILRLTGVAFWSVGWAVTNQVTVPLLNSASDWMTNLTAAAVNMPPTASNVPSVAAAAPLLAWGVLFLFIALTTVLCVGTIGSLVLAIVTLSRSVAGGIELVTSASEHSTGTAPARTGLSSRGVSTSIVRSMRNQTGNVRSVTSSPRPVASRVRPPASGDNPFVTGRMALSPSIFSSRSWSSPAGGRPTRALSRAHASSTRAARPEAPPD
jgi:hypothetical protein